MDYRDRRLGQPTMDWPYRNADGDLLFYMVRWNYIDDAGAKAKKVRIGVRAKISPPII